MHPCSSIHKYHMRMAHQALGMHVPDQETGTGPMDAYKARTTKDIREALQAGILGQEAAAQQATTPQQQQAPAPTSAAPEQATTNTAQAPKARCWACLHGMPGR